MTDWKICILMPTYNNAKTLRRVVEEVGEVCPDIIVVNDGSTDQSREILRSISSITLIDYNLNQGKGFALQQGFEKAHEMGFDFAITIDSDGQHEPHNIRDLIAALNRESEHVLLMGSRNMGQAGIPKKSSFGNKFSSFWYWAETGKKLADTQTGFRAYPLVPLQNMRWFTNRFEFEIEIIVRLAWKNIPVNEVPVLVNYPEDRVSHFRPFADFMRISALNTVLFFMAAFYHTPKRVIFGVGEKSLWQRLKREFTKHGDHPVKMSASVGLGLFFGVFPIWGFQMLVAFFLASVFKLNRAVVLAASNISLPPLVPFIIYGSYLLGGLFFETSVALPAFSDLTLESMYIHFKQYFVGAVLLSFILGVFGFFISFAILQLRQKKA